MLPKSRRSPPLLLLLLSSLTSTTSTSLAKRQSCSAGYSTCAPSGATSTTIPAIGPGLAPLYVDLVNSVQGIKARKRGMGEMGREERGEAAELRERDDSADGENVCCVDGTSCLLLLGLSTPFCYDPFTTNFFLPDSSYGTIDSGTYTPSSASGGGTCNLITGAYTLGSGASGNIYSADPAASPNTATLNLPTPYTSAGVGTPIPAGGLGEVETFTITIPGTTIIPTTIVGQTTIEVLPSVVGATATLPGATTTIPGPAGQTEVVTLAPSLEGGNTVGSITSTIAEQGTTVQGTTVQGTTEVITSMLGGDLVSSTGSASLVASSSVSKAGGDGMYGRGMETGIWGVVGIVVLGLLGL
ncbi:MAG: hypothetical protein MMC33_009898 [Icmadophila ericetorum]|nr:hypothetical protein [Icmadophila ericetorum]